MTSTNSYILELLQKFNEQIFLVGIATMIAISIGVPVGLMISYIKRLKSPILAISAILWTIPSLALLAFLVPFLGIGMPPAILVLSIYAVLPIIRTTNAGIESISPHILEAAKGLGFTKFQRLYLVELPLALPIIISGLRTAVIITIGIATLAAFIGAGGLGDFINRGLATNNNFLILLGAIPAALLALIFDFLISRLEKYLTFQNYQKALVIFGISIFFILGLLASQFFYRHYTIQNVTTIRIATKNFTEQFILGEIMAQLLEDKTSLPIVRKFNLGTTEIVHKALLHDEIDLYPEYTGTAYLLILKGNSQSLSPEKIYQFVKTQYEQRYQLILLPPFGFNNTQAIAIRKSFAKKYQLEKIGDLNNIATSLTIAAPPEFIARPDGMLNLQKHYGLKFSEIKSMDPSLVYSAIQQENVNVIMAFSTDSHLKAYQLQILQDDKQTFLPYYAAPVVRSQLLQKHPEIANVLQLLENRLDEKTMQELNYQVDILHHSPFNIAKEFLCQRKLITHCSSKATVHAPREAVIARSP